MRENDKKKGKWEGRKKTFQDKESVEETERGIQE